MLDFIGSLCFGLSMSMLLIWSLYGLLMFLEQAVRDSVRDEFRRRDERCRLRDLNETPKPDSQA